MKKKSMTQEDVASFATGKVRAKGKIKRAEREQDDEIGGKMSDHIVLKKKKAELDTECKVGAGQLRGVVSESIARVYSEIWPSMQTHTDRNGGVDIEIAEEGYILVLAMVVGNQHEQPRKGLKIKESEMKPHFCQEHA